jgi:uncharacterized protein involved in exopolysaccharide biosynthesis
MSEEQANRRMENEKKTYDHEPGEFNILRYVNILLKRRWLIVGGVFVTCVLAAVYFRSQPRVYSAWGRFLPSRTQDISSRLGSVLGGGSPYESYSSEYITQYYTQILSSSGFLAHIAQKKFSIGTPGQETDLISYYQVDGSTEAEKLSKAADEISARLDISTPSGSRNYGTPDIITVSYSADNPLLAADIVNTILDELMAYDQSLRNSEAKQNRVFIENQLKETQTLLNNAEQALADFTVKNKRLGPELEVERDRLKRNVTVQEEVFITLKKQLELAKIAELEKRTSIEILDRAVPPRRPSKPQVRRSVKIAAVVSLMAFCALAFLLEFMGKINSRDEKNRELFEQLGNIKEDFIRLGRLVGVGRHNKRRKT